MKNEKIYSPWQINSYIKNILENDSKINNITIVGEISNITYHQSGHLYFTLKDDKSSIKGICFRSNLNNKIKFKLGDKVVVIGSIQGYVPTGSYSFEARKMDLEGEGDLNSKYEKLKEKLEKEGLFDSNVKKTIPKMPNKIGIITSPTGAVLHDILNMFKKRNSISDIYIFPTKVQGDNADQEIINALQSAEQKNMDVIIIARGGGSIEDLWSFNSEEIARYIFNMNTPIISGVGHEPDTTIIDYVVDKSCSTPTAAAEMVSYDMKEISMQIDNILDVLTVAINKKINDLEKIINIDNIASSINRNLEDKQNNLNYRLKILELRNPIEILKKGYSVSKNNGKIIKSVKEVSVGNNINIEIYDGIVEAEIISVESRNNERN